MKPNRPHFHVWVKARSGRAYFRLAKGYWTRQAASQAAKRRYAGEPWRKPMVLHCEEERCAPKLD